ncbi:Bestrophin, RFP-TM, chloride channel-domain-containing protein, partial [Pavlovales sp. CCMP2436]
MAAFVVVLLGATSLATRLAPRLAVHADLRRASLVSMGGEPDPAIAETRRLLNDLWKSEVSTSGSVSPSLYGDANADQTTLGVRISRDSTITKLWAKEDWVYHMNQFRYFRHIVFWPRSTVVRALRPLIACLACWSVVVYRLQCSLPLQALALSASPLGLLLAFRVNAATARFGEARGQWGRAVLHARDAAAIINAMPTVPPATRAVCCRLLCCFGWAAKASLRGEDSLHQVLETLLPPAMAAWVDGRRKPTLGLLALLRQLTANTGATTAAAQGLSTCLSDLNACFGGMERLYSTPLSPTYMRHTTRGLLLWLAMMPAGLFGAGVPLMQTLVAVLATAYITLGIEV